MGLLAVFCLLPVFSPVMAEDILERPDGTVYTDETTGYKVEIHDDASLLEDSQLHALAKEMKGLTQYGSAGFLRQISSIGLLRHWHMICMTNICGNRAEQRKAAHSF